MRGKEYLRAFWKIPRMRVEIMKYIGMESQRLWERRIKQRIEGKT